jgi:hypothetical protein
MADATDLKSVDRKVVWVRLPPSAPIDNLQLPVPARKGRLQLSDCERTVWKTRKASCY